MGASSHHSSLALNFGPGRGHRREAFGWLECSTDGALRSGRCHTETSPTWQATHRAWTRAMIAAEIARALGDARREGLGWRCRCPLHQGRSLTLRDGDGGCVLVTCWGGCDRLDAIAELRRRGLLHGRAIRHGARTARRSNKDNGARTSRALGIWREARQAVGTLAEQYLISRDLCLPPPPTL